MSSEPPVIHVALSAEPLDVHALMQQVRRPDCGAIVTFEGTVRTPDRGREVSRLEYEAYADRALRQMDELARAAAAEHGARAIVLVHRTGAVHPAGTAIVVSAAAPHRSEAFAAASQLLEQVKQHVAIWKQEFGDGGAEWIEP